MIGTPMTGSAVCAATPPAKCAAPPAPQINPLYPLVSLAFTYSTTASGVRCAESVCPSEPIPNSSSTLAASCITGRSESEPMRIPTRGLFAMKVLYCISKELKSRSLVRQGLVRQGLTLPYITLAEIRPMRKLREAYRALGVRHEPQYTASVAYDTGNILKRAVGIPRHIEML